MLWVAVFILFSLVSRAVYLHRDVTAMALVRRDASGWLSHEVRRRVSLVALPGHISAYPVPRERSAFESFGLPVWSCGIQS